MATGADRQRKYQERLKAEGRIRFTVHIVPEAAEVLEAEKNKSGETYNDIISRVLLAFPSVSDNVNTDTPISDKSVITDTAKPVSTNHDTIKETVVITDTINPIEKPAIKDIQPVSTDTPIKSDVAVKPVTSDEMDISKTVITDTATTDKKPVTTDKKISKRKKTPEEIQRIIKRAAALKSEGLSFVNIEKQMRKEGFDVSKSALQRMLTGK